MNTMKNKKKGIDMKIMNPFLKTKDYEKVNSSAYRVVTIFNIV